MKKHILFSLIAVLVVAVPALQAAAVPGRGKKVRLALPTQWPMNLELRAAVIKGDVDEVKRLLGRGVDVNAQDDDGNTALILSAMYGKPAVVRELIAQKGIDINVQNKDGKKAFDWASSNDLPPVEPGVTASSLLDLVKYRILIKFKLRRMSNGAGAGASGG